MNQRIAQAVSLGLMLTQLGCGGCGGPASVYEPPTPIDVADGQAPPSPALWLSVHGHTELSLAPDAPWLVDALVQHPGALGAPVTGPLSLGDGPAETAFTLQLTDAQGGPVSAAFERLGAPLAEPLTLAVDTVAALRWRLPSTEAGKLAHGTYWLTLSLNAGTMTSASPPVAVTLSPSPDGGVETPLARADEAMARGALGEAEAELDALLLQNPEHVAALTRKAFLREAASDNETALATYRAALSAAVKAAPNAPEGGPRHLYRKVEALRPAADGGAY